MKPAAAVQRQQRSIRRVVAHAERASMHVRQRITHHPIRAAEATRHHRKPNHHRHNQQSHTNAKPLQQFSLPLHLSLNFGTGNLIGPRPSSSSNFSRTFLYRASAFSITVIAAYAGRISSTCTVLPSSCLSSEKNRFTTSK